MDILTVINPITVSITTGLVLGMGMLVALWKGSVQIKTAALWMKSHVFNWTCFFWVVNLVCMAFSAQNAGYIFGLYESTGIFLGVALDLLIIAFTQAMLAAKARGERSRAKKILAFIVFCCLLSTAGNLAHNLHTTITDQTSGVWFQQAIPYLVSTMPLFLIALAWVADLKVNPIASMDIEEYKANEKKHLDFLEIQIDNREVQAKIEQRMITLEALEKRNRQLRRGKAPRSFRWPWEPKIDIDKIVADVAENMKVFYEEKIASAANNYQQNLKEMQRLSEAKQVDLEGQIQGLLGQIQQGILQENEDYRNALAEQYDQDIAHLQGRITDAMIEMQTSDHADGNIDEMPGSRVSNRREKARQIEETIELDEETKMIISQYQIVESWLSRKDRSVSLQEIIDGTKHSPQRVHKAHKSGAFRKTRKEGFYRLDSVITWLRTVPLPKSTELSNGPITGEISPALSDGNSRSNGHKNLTQPLGDLAELEV